MSNVTTVGIDLAKNVFAVHGVDGLGQVVLRRTVRRGSWRRWLPVATCLIGMEACTGAHQWARRLPSSTTRCD
jgi:transposase